MDMGHHFDVHRSYIGRPIGEPLEKGINYLLAQKVLLTQ